MRRVGIVAGSFDPITHGHTWLISEAAKLVDELIVVVGNNPSKKYMFTIEERVQMVTDVITDDIKNQYNIRKVQTIDNQLLVHYAQSVGATYLIRGIRNAQDFNYEYEMNLVNKNLVNTIDTIFLATPRNMSEISSSTVRGIAGFDGWQGALLAYVNPLVIKALEEKRAV